MSYYRRRLYATWIAISFSFVFPVLICVAIFATTPELREPIVIATISFAVYFASILYVLLRADRVGEATRRAAAPGAVVFGAFNHPGALVHVGDYLLPGAPLARGLSFVVEADDRGLSYLTAGKTPAPFAYVPWSDIDRVSEVGGELAVTLVDGAVQYIVPGARLPAGARRVRALAAQISALQRERQP